MAISSGRVELPPGLDVQTAVRGGLFRVGWRAALLLGARRRSVLLTTTGGARFQLALEGSDVEVVLDAVGGRPVRVPGTPDAPNKPEAIEKRTSPKYLGDRLVERPVRVVGWPAVPLDGDPRPPGDIAAQLDSCLDDVREQLARLRVPLADTAHVRILATDLPAGRVQAELLSERLRLAGAATSVSTVAVSHLSARGAAVELELITLGYSWSDGDPLDEDPPTPVPGHLRSTVRVELDALARGERPEALTDLAAVGAGAVLVVQPEAVWEHPWSSASCKGDEYHQGQDEWVVTVPLWTTTDAPGDLFAHVELDSSGRATRTAIFASRRDAIQDWVEGRGPGQEGRAAR